MRSHEKSPFFNEVPLERKSSMKKAIMVREFGSFSLRILVRGAYHLLLDSHPHLPSLPSVELSRGASLNSLLVGGQTGCDRFLPRMHCNLGREEGREGSYLIPPGDLEEVDLGGTQVTEIRMDHFSTEPWEEGSQERWERKTRKAYLTTRNLLERRWKNFPSL